MYFCVKLYIDVIKHFSMSLCGVNICVNSEVKVVLSHIVPLLLKNITGNNGPPLMLTC